MICYNVFIERGILPNPCLRYAMFKVIVLHAINGRYVEKDLRRFSSNDEARTFAISISTSHPSMKYAIVEWNGSRWINQQWIKNGK